MSASTLPLIVVSADVEGDRGDTHADGRPGRRHEPRAHAGELRGIALCAAIDRVVRAVGRIVVSVEAAAELSTMRISRCTAKRAERAVAEHRLAEHREHVVGVVRVSQPDAGRADAGVRLGGGRHDDVDRRAARASR